MPRSLIVEIFGNAAQFAGELDKAAGKTRQFGKVAGVAGLAIAGGLVYGLEKSAKAAMAGQVSQAALEQSLRTTHQSLTAMKPALDDAQAAGRNLGFADDETRASLARLELATGSTKSAISDLSVAEGLARLKHIDLTTATNAMAQAMTGSQRAAKTLGIIVPTVTTNLDKLKASGENLTTETGHLDEAHAKLLDKMATGQAVIQATSDKVAGQAQAFSDSAAGGMARFHAESQHLQETLGNSVLPALNAVTGALATGASFLAAHTTVTKIAIGALALLATGLIAVSVATRVVAAAQAIMTAAQWALNVALDANPIGIIIIALIALGVGLVEAYRHSQTFRDIVAAALNFVKGVAMDLVGAFGSIESVARTVWAVVEKVVKVAAGVISAEIGGIVGAFDTVLGVLGSIEGAAASALGAIASVFTANNSSHTVGGSNAAATRARGGIPGRAIGGPVSAGSPYIVGERGPELFVPGASGVIVPNGAGGGGANITLMVGPVYGAIDQATARQWAAPLKAELDRVIKL